MNFSLRCAKMIVLAALTVVSRTNCLSQALPALSGEQVLKNIEDTFTGIQDYTADLDVQVDLDRLKVPRMHVTMYFKRPEKVHFETDGFALLPREGMALSFGRLRTRYSLESVKKDTLAGGSVTVLTMKSKTDKSKLHDLLLYVNPQHWTVTRFISPQTDGRVMTVSFEYQPVEGYWLPSSLVVSFAAGPSDTTDLNLFEQITPTRRAQQPRNGTITIRYSNYRLNTGLSDEIFERKSNRAGTE